MKKVLKDSLTNKNFIEKYCKNAGLIFIILGVIHIFLSGFLSLTWGILLIILGIIILSIKESIMIGVVGSALILIGFLNLWNNIYEPSVLWSILGVVQIFFGVKELIRFKAIRESPQYKKEKKKKEFVWHGMRIGFGAMFFLWLFETLFANQILNLENFNFVIMLFLLELSLPLFVIITSIIHLNMYKSKGFAVLSLTLSTLYFIMVLFSFFINLFV